GGARFDRNPVCRGGAGDFGKGGAADRSRGRGRPPGAGTDRTGGGGDDGGSGERGPCDSPGGANQRGERAHREFALGEIVGGGRFRGGASADGGRADTAVGVSGYSFGGYREREGFLSRSEGVRGGQRGEQLQDVLFRTEG